ncbi:MAG TPA: YIP1 family protein [Candidatus Dormibacteraeota bacterium]|nr:YIP1 family protein [Candidatus Dormibacteraeota bacterium]
MLLGDLVGMTLVPWRRAPRLAEGRPVGLAAALVVLTGAASMALSLAAVAVEPAGAGQHGADVGASVVLPALFAGFWLIDALVVDAVAQLMGRPSRRRRYLEVTGYAWPVLAVFAVVRLGQALVDRAAGIPGSTAGNALGFLDFALLAWFLVLVTTAVQAVYELPAASALSAALAPLAVVAALLMLLIVVGTILHGVGVG